MSLIRPTMLHVAVVGHHGQVAGVHPPVGIDRLGGLVGVVPVARHHRVPAGAELAGHAALDRFAGLGVGDPTSTWGWALPTVAVRWWSESSGSVWVDTGEVSVMP